MTIAILPEVLTDLIDRARRGTPREVCGLLGVVNDTIIHAVAMRNTDSAMNAFALDPAEQVAIQRSMRANNQRLWGVYHSHPAGPAIPSVKDRALAHGVPLFQVIIGLGDDEPDVRAYAPEYLAECELVIAKGRCNGAK